MDAETQAVKSQDTAPVNEKQAQTAVEETTETFSQDAVNKIVAERLAKEKAKYEKKYSGIDLDHYNKLIEKEEKARQAELEKRGEFEKLLKEHKAFDQPDGFWIDKPAPKMISEDEMKKQLKAKDEEIARLKAKEEAKSKQNSMQDALK